LFLYSIIKIIPFYKWFPKIAWRDIERVLLVVGVIGAFVANSTGEIAEQIARPDHNLVEMHALFASMSTWFYGLLLLGELVAFINPFVLKWNLPKTSGLLTFIQNILINKTISITLAILGFIAISVTGLLGGVMVFGTTADPIADVVLQILGLN
jgi:hypothetical protein